MCLQNITYLKQKASNYIYIVRIKDKSNPLSLS